jgi:plastocyanin
MRVRTGFVFVLTVATLLLVAGCGSSAGSKSSTPTTVDPARYTDKTAAKTVTVDARDDLFTPRYVKIRAGTTVVFENAGRNQHNVLSVDGAFRDIETDAFAPGTKARVVFAKAGAHDYYCSLHGSPTAGMNGSILVAP